MEPLGGSENPSSTTVHTLQLAGILCGGEGNILVRTRMTFSVDQGVTIEMSARAEKPKAVQLVMSAIA
ncbi:coatomer subunit gamma [Puccinia graminis f. sp. tritici]|jgi:coatomer protein complex subunit gamma|nr:coatomer subunit gamma [Puccinia graminis f. sp. tritici]